MGVTFIFHANLVVPKCFSLFCQHGRLVPGNIKFCSTCSIDVVRKKLDGQVQNAARQV